MAEKIKSQGSLGDHLANERTFLAWIRTSIGIMAFGFVVVKFSLFLKQISIILGKGMVDHSKGYSSVAGIVLVIVGAITAVLSYIRYKLLRQIKYRNILPNQIILTRCLSF